jgi:CheY-like chemotaxis protein
MVEPKTVLLLSAHDESLQSREEQLRGAGFATHFATNANELQTAFQCQKVDVAVIASALPAKEKLRITTILHNVAKSVPIVLLNEAGADVVDNPDVVIKATAPPDEFVSTIKQVFARPNSQRL